MFRNLYFAFNFINIVIFASGGSVGIYTVIAPGTLHPYFNYNVAITVHQADGPCEIEVAVHSSSYNISKTVSILPMTTENVEFEMSELERDDYYLSVKGVSGILFENSTNLNFENYKPLVFIQIDKPIYNPGDLVQFRVLFLNQKTHPEHLKTPMTISMKNGAEDIVQQWKNINLTHGVYTGNFQLSENAMPDWWYISVFDGKTQLQLKKFALVEYELPNFEVSMDVPKDVPETDEFITITIRSKYTFGKPVRGKATVSIANYYGGNASYSNKTFLVDGKGHAEFHIWKELPNSELILYQFSGFNGVYEVMAYVEDDLTGKKQNAEDKNFVLRKNNIEMTALNAFIKCLSGKLITYTVIGKRFDGSPVSDNMNIVELSINELTFHSVFNQSGMATFNFVLQAMNGGSVYAKYLDTQTYLGQISIDEQKAGSHQPERFQLILKTEKPQLKKELLIEVEWTEPIDYFVYILVARGNIIKNERVEVPNDSQSYVIKLITTLDMIPEASIFVQYVYNDNLRFEEMSITFERDFENTLEISTTAEASPGDYIEFKLTTDPYSYVGLLGVDQSVLLYGTDHNLKANDVFIDLQYKYQTQTHRIIGSDRYPGQISGLVSLTNAHFPWSHRPVPDYSKSPGLYSPVPRKKFPETWIFENFNTTNQTQFSFTRKIPDTITSWVITGFSMNSNTGFALTKSPTKIQVFKPFFITINLPHSVKQGEIISVPVSVFNYMNQAINAEVTLDNSDNEFDFVEAANEIEERIINKVKDFKRISMPDNSAGSVSFLIRPKNIGILTLKVTALTALAGDSVHMKLKVESDGVTQYQNRAFSINLSKNPEQTETLILDIPANAVPNSEHIELSAIGNLVGISIKHIEDLVRLPVGYGEQNMINFVPSILILKYLETIDEKMPNVTKTARNILRIGFQRELSFRHSDGSYSAYGATDITGRLYESDGKSVTGSTWLTAYVARSFQQASEFIDIDEGIIMKSFEFLAAKQTISGNFAEFGRLLAFPHLNDMSLTAFVLLAFLENKENSTKYEMHINRGIGYLVRSFGDTDDTYSLSITALVLQKASHPLADQVLAKLKQNAKNQNGLTWWSIDTGRQKRQTHAFKSSDIEITSYILLAMLEKGPTEDALPIIKWLTMQRNSNGGFTSTQDTVVGLQALIKFAETTGLTRTGVVNIDYMCEGNGVKDKGTITIIPENLMVFNTHELPKNTRKVTFTAKGNSSSLVQLSYKYNTIDKDPERSFRLHVSTRENAPPKLLLIDICAKFVPTDVVGDENKTNMIVIEVNLPSGFYIGKEELDGIRDFETILYTETKKSDTVAVIYLSSLEVGQEKCISIEATKIHDIAIAKPYFSKAVGIYTVTSPGTLHSYFNYKVAITVHQAEGPCEIVVSVYSSTYKISKTVSLLPMSTENVEFEMSKLEQDDYRLSVKGVSGILFENSTNLNFASYNPLVYIQMDKPIYKPGDSVQFRVLFLNQITHPEHLKTPMTIVIKNGDGDPVQQWKNINFTHGVYTGNFQLSENSMQD